jgi:hypothetical protein
LVGEPVDGDGGGGCQIHPFDQAFITELRQPGRQQVARYPWQPIDEVSESAVSE